MIWMLTAVVIVLAVFVIRQDVELDDLRSKVEWLENDHNELEAQCEAAFRHFALYFEDVNKGFYEVHRKLEKANHATDQARRPAE